MTVQHPDTRPLEFSIALRGYDRIQVDEYIDRLHALLEQAEDRVRRAEAPHDSAQVAEVGPRITQIFELAREEADELRERARNEANELVRRARHEADALLRANQDEWDRLLDEYEAERDRIRNEVRTLNERKSLVVGELRRLRETLGLASDISEDATVEATRELPVRTEEHPVPGSLELDEPDPEA